MSLPEPLDPQTLPQALSGDLHPKAALCGCWSEYFGVASTGPSVGFLTLPAGAHGLFPVFRAPLVLPFGECLEGNNMRGSCWAVEAGVPAH